MAMDRAEDTLEARLARVRRREYVKALRKREWVVLAVFLVLVLLCFANLKRVVVHGGSMEPTLHSGQTVFVWKTAPRDSLRPGDVIVFRYTDGQELIKRIVFIQDARGTRRFPASIWTPKGMVSSLRLFGAYFAGVAGGALPTPPPGNTIYVMGDNFEKSDDSRDFGPISPGQVLGKVVP